MKSTMGATPFVAAMTAVVLASNILVQFPVTATLGPLQLADVLTWGAFTYPVSFLITDLANRRHGAAFARRIVFAGFLTAVVASLVAPPLLNAVGLLPFGIEGARLARIATASGLAFLTAQLLDVAIFNGLRRRTWWRAPIFGSLAGSVLDTTVFFSVAFAAAFAIVGPGDPFAAEIAPVFGVGPAAFPRWVSWALGDLSVKLIIAVVALIPYRLIAARWALPKAA